MQKYLVYVIDPGVDYVSSDSICDICIIEAESEKEAKEQAYALLNNGMSLSFLAEYRAVPFNELEHGTVVW